MGEGEREGNGSGCSPEGENTGSFVLRLLSFSCRQESEGSIRGGFGRMFLSSPDTPLQGHGLLIGQWQGRRSLVIAAGSAPLPPPAFAAFLGL